MCMEHLPHPSRWQHVLIASVRPFGIVELNDVSHQSPRFFKVMGTFHLIKPFLLDDAIHALCYGIVRRLVVLRHADGGIDTLQMFYIQAAAVLYAAVRMMNQPLKPQIGDLFDAHIQGCHGIGGYKAVREDPSDDLMGKGISEQMKIDNSRIRINISNVSHPQLVGTYDRDSFYQITVFKIVMIGIRRMAASQWFQHKVVLMHQPVEPVTPFHLFGIQFPEHQKKLIGSYAWGLTTDFLYCSDDLCFGQFLTHALILADSIITLATFAKQSAQVPDGFTGMPEPKVVYCLAPAFFSRSIPYRSRPIFSTSWRASLRSSE